MCDPDSDGIRTQLWDAWMSGLILGLLFGGAAGWMLR